MSVAFGSYSDYSYCRSCNRTHNINWAPINKTSDSEIIIVAGVYNYYSNCLTTSEPIFCAIIDNNWIGVSKAAHDFEKMFFFQRCSICKKAHTRIFHQLTYDENIFYFMCNERMVPEIVEMKYLKLWMGMPMAAKAAIEQAEAVKRVVQKNVEAPL